MKYDEILVLDICGTIYQGNSTVDFINFVKKEFPIRWMKYTLSCFANRVMKKTRLIGACKAKINYQNYEVKFFIGLNEVQIKNLSDIFWNARKNRYNNDIINKIHDFEETALASAAMPFLVETLANNLGVKYAICRDKKVVNNRYEHFGNSILDTKPLIIKEKFHKKKVVFYSDNIEDYKCKDLFYEFIYVK